MIDSPISTQHQPLFKRALTLVPYVVAACLVTATVFGLVACEGFGGDAGSTMRPGEDCGRCHGQRFTIAGTVYAKVNAPNDSTGVSGVTVQITDGNGAVHNFTTNSSGNFVARDRQLNLVMPYTAKIIYQGKSRPMLLPRVSGDCGSCHTPTGAHGAPGRIIIP